jgi:hypothetical protein
MGDSQPPRADQPECGRVEGLGDPLITSLFLPNVSLTAGLSDTFGENNKVDESAGVGPQQAAEEARDSTQAEDEQAEHHSADEGVARRDVQAVHVGPALLRFSHAAHPFAPSDPASVSIET